MSASAVLESKATRPARGGPGAAVADARSRYRTADEPWSRRDVAVAGAVVAIGLILLGVCWYGVSGEATLEEQTPWLAGAVLSLMVSTLGVALWLVRGFRAVRGGQRQIIAETRSALGLSTDRLASRPATGGAAVLVAVPGLTRVHRPDCPFVRGKDVQPMSAQQASAAGLAPCGVCVS